MDKSHSLLRRTDLGFYSAQHFILEVELGVDIAKEFHITSQGATAVLLVETTRYGYVVFRCIQRTPARVV